MLAISIKTVEHHRANILAKLDMRDRIQLTRYAIRAASSNREAIEFTDHCAFAPGLRSIRCRVVLDALARAHATHERCRGPQASRTTHRQL